MLCHVSFIYLKQISGELSKKAWKGYCSFCHNASSIVDVKELISFTSILVVSLFHFSFSLWVTQIYNFQCRILSNISKSTSMAFFYWSWRGILYRLLYNFFFVSNETMEQRYDWPSYMFACLYASWALLSLLKALLVNT